MDWDDTEMSDEQFYQELVIMTKNVFVWGLSQHVYWIIRRKNRANLQKQKTENPQKP